MPLQQNFKDKDIVIKAKAAISDSLKIYEKLISLVSMKYKYKPSRYHVTIGYIENVNLEDIDQLTEFLNNNIVALRKNYSSIIFEIESAAFFSRKIAFTTKKPDIFIKLNAEVSEILANFQSITTCKYKLEKTTCSENYIPHLTIGAGDEIDLQKIQETIIINYNLRSKSIEMDKLLAKIIP